MLQGYSEEFLKATADQPGILGGTCPEPTSLEEESEDRRSNL